MDSSLIDTLLDTLDLIDKGTEATKIAKETTLVTLGFGKMGDKYPITSKDIENWVKLRREHHQALQNGHAQYAESIRRLLLSSTIDLINRCFTSGTAEALFDKLSKRWGI